VSSFASAAPLPAFTVSVDHPRVGIKIGQDGFFVLAADVALVFPDLDSSAYALNLTVQAAGFQQVNLPVPIPAGSVFPLAFLGVALHNQPLRIEGRITMGLGGAPVGDAPVVIAVPNLLTLRTPMHFDHTAGIPVQACTFTPLGAARALVQPGAFLASELILDNIAGLAAGSLLRLGSPSSYEFIVVDGPGPQPGQVLLRGGLRHSLPAGAVAQPVTPAAGAGGVLNGDAAAGHGVLWIAAGLPASGIVIQDPDPARLDYHALGALSSAAPEDSGYYRIDGIVDLHAITLHAENPGGTHIADQGWNIDLFNPVNNINLRLFAP
jgi:hypothetical protein